MKQRYKIVLESDEVLADDEFRQKAENLLAMYNGEDPIIASFKVVEAINLEGMKEDETKEKDESRNERQTLSGNEE